MGPEEPDRRPVDVTEVRRSRLVSVTMELDPRRSGGPPGRLNP